MKKAGVCVRYDCDNFGSMLQILATQKALKQVGWDYEIIRYDKRTLAFYIKNITRIFNPYFMRGKIESFQKRQALKKYPEIQKKDAKRNQCIAEYREVYIGPYSEIYKGYSKLVEGTANYDAVLVGSDQLWTPAGIKSKFYNLLFVPDTIKKVSFATSFGVGAIPSSQKKMTKQYLNRIDHISVREIRGAELVKELINREATVALDPTLLYTGDDWKDIFPEQHILSEPYILAYFLGSNESHRDAVEQLKKDTKLKIVTIPFMDAFVERDLIFGDEQLFEVGPIEFLNLIRGAEYICTDSFHGSVFSILNHKKFLTFNRTNNDDKQTRNSRIDSLFELLDLEKRRYVEGMNVSENIRQPIQYVEVEKKLVKLRQETFDFLDKALNT